MTAPEYKFVELKSLKMSEDNEFPGTIEGLRAVFDIDEGADLIIKGAFLDTLEEYLNSGFSAHSHQWSFDQAIGFPVVARETDRGLFVKSQFHSTPDAQLIRTKAKERMKAGKTVGFSFGYSVRDSDVIRAHEYERELPRYVSPDRLPYNMAQAKRFPQIRLLKKLHVIEDSIVTAPMNKLAMATGVKCEHCASANIASSKISVPALREQYARNRIVNLRLKMRSMEVLHGIDLGVGPTAGELRLKSEEIRNGIRRRLATSLALSVD